MGKMLYNYHPDGNGRGKRKMGGIYGYACPSFYISPFDSFLAHSPCPAVNKFMYVFIRSERVQFQNLFPDSLLRFLNINGCRPFQNLAVPEILRSAKGSGIPAVRLSLRAELVSFPADCQEEIHLKLHQRPVKP